MGKWRLILFTFLILLIITIPTFTSLLNNQYFSIHDNQHIVRLYLLDQGIKQGYLYPRWVDKLSFGFGDPLFNFYPPLVYYIGELFHLMGFSLIWSIKLVFILGFLTATRSMYLLVKEYLGRLAGFLGASVYGYFFYHAINSYVRGALSEFWTMSLLPLVFLAFYELSKNINLKNAIFFGIILALIMLTHQLIALILIFFLIFYFIYSFFSIKKDNIKFIKYLLGGSLLGLGLSAFYWLPMFTERIYTFLGQELGGYKLHYVYPYQFWYSPWGFGGSAPGLNDGMTFQLGKIPILLILISFCLFIVYWFKFKKTDETTKNYIFFAFLLIFSLFMTTSYSSFVWDNLTLLWNLQFPWRFLVFTAIFVSLIGSYSVFFLQKILKNNKNLKYIPLLFTVFFILIIILKYQQYFQPQRLWSVSDKDLTTYDEIAWTQSKTVLHFSPKSAKTKKDEYGVYILDIEKNNLPKQIYEIKFGSAEVTILENKFADKKFSIKSQTPLSFQLNTFNFLGWTAYLNNQRIIINDNNKYKLITVYVPKGEHILKFSFQDTPVRRVANVISIFTFIIFIIFTISSVYHYIRPIFFFSHL